MTNRFIILTGPVGLRGDAATAWTPSKAMQLDEMIGCLMPSSWQAFGFGLKFSTEPF
jgi:hypothetical protein